MDRWKADMGRVREEKRRRKKIKKEKVPEEKRRKVAKHCVFPMICGSGGSKSRLAKAAGAEPSGQMRDGKLHAVVARRTFASEKLKIPHVRNTFRSCDVEKVHAVVARSTFASEKAKNTSRSEHFSKLWCRQSARRCGAKHMSKSKVLKKTDGFRPLLEVEMSKKCTPLWRDAHFEVKMLKAPHVRATFGLSDVSEQNVRVFMAFPKTMAGVGHFEEDLQRCTFCGRRRTRDMFIRDVRRSGRWFPERGCILEHQIFSFGKMILRDRCSTLYDLASLFRGRRNTLDRWSGKIAKRIGTRPSALHSTFHFGRKSRRIASFLMLSTAKLAELFRLWHCQVQKLGTSRRIAPFLMLSSSKTEEVSQNSFVFKLSDRQIDR